MNHKKLAQKILSVIGLAILGIFIYKVDLSNTLKSLQNLSISTIIMIIAITASHILIKALRWRALIYRTSREKISIRFSFLSVIAGVAFGSIIPGRIEMAKPLMLKEKANIPISTSFPCVLMERICELITLLAIIFISTFFISKQEIISNSIIFTALGAALAITLSLALFPERYQKLSKLVILRLSFSEKMSKQLEEFSQQFFAAFSILKDKHLFLFLSLFSAFAILLEVLQFYLILQVFGVNVSVPLSAFVLGSTTILGVLSMIPGGIGIIEVSSSAILLLLTSGTAGAIQSSVLLNRLISYYLLILFGALILIFYRNLRKELNDKIST